MDMRSIIQIVEHASRSDEQPNKPPVVKFKKEATSQSVSSLAVLVDGEKIGEITSASFDRHARRSASSGYDVYLLYKGQRFRHSDMILSDMKKAVTRFVYEVHGNV